VRIVAWINGVVFGCAEDTVDILAEFGADAEAGFQAGTELRSRAKPRKRI
jgi:hypothetical protein